METLRYRELLTQLDAQIEEAKREEDARRCEEERKARIAHLDHQIRGLVQRRDLLTKYHRTPEVDLDHIIEDLQREKAAVEREMEPPEVSLEDIEREMVTFDFSGTTGPERWALYEIWAINWKLALRPVGYDANALPHAKRVFAKLRALMDGDPYRGPAIPALIKGQNDRHWELELDYASQRLQSAREERMKHAFFEETQTQRLKALAKACVAHRGDAGSDETLRLLKHAVREAASIEHLRAEVALYVQEWKDLLGAEFSFLWGHDTREVDAPSKDPLARTEIVRRILRRMKANSLIGASHGPFEWLYKGFPAHDQGTAKEALEILGKVGMVRLKDSVIGLRAAIEPDWMRVVDQCIAGVFEGVPVALANWLEG